VNAGYFNPAAIPMATPAAGRRPAIMRTSATATPRVSGTSVTAIREYATCVTSTAVTAAATKPAVTP
jgi:hypothetical protein